MTSIDKLVTEMKNDLEYYKDFVMRLDRKVFVLEKEVKHLREVIRCSRKPSTASTISKAKRIEIARLKKNSERKRDDEMEQIASGGSRNLSLQSTSQPCVKIELTDDQSDEYSDADHSMTAMTDESSHPQQLSIANPSLLADEIASASTSSPMNLVSDKESPSSMTSPEPERLKRPRSRISNSQKYHREESSSNDGSSSDSDGSSSSNGRCNSPAPPTIPPPEAEDSNNESDCGTVVFQSVQSQGPQPKKNKRGRGRHPIWIYFDRQIRLKKDSSGSYIQAVCQFCKKCVSAKPTRLQRHNERCKKAKASVQVSTLPSK